MSPITADLEELQGEGSISDSLFTQNTEDVIFNPPAVPFEPELPAAVAQEPEESALDVYLREKAQREEEERIEAEALASKVAGFQEYLKNPDLESIAPLDKETGYGEPAVKLIEKQKAENYERDFGWLGGEKMPGWTKYKESNRVLREGWETFTPEQKVKAFDHYSNQAAKYYTQYNKVSPDKFGEAIQNVLIKNPDLIDANVKLEEDRLEAAGHGRGWKDTVIRGADTATLGLLPVKDNPGYESMSAGLTASNAYKQAGQLLKDLKEIETNGGEIFNEDGTVNLQQYNEAVNAIKEDIPGDGLDTLGQELAVQKHEDLLRAINDLGPDPEGRIRGLLGAAKGYSRIGQLQMTKLSPELQEGLSGHRILPNALGQQEDKIPDTERIKKILSKPGEFIVFTAGMVLAQQSDLLEETLASGGIAAAIGSPILGLAGNAYAAGQQEAALVATDLIQEGLRERGYDPFSITDWERAYDSGVAKELVKEAESKGQLKGLTTAGVESVLGNVFLAGLKRVPYFGVAASGLKRLPQLAGKGLSHGTSGFASAASGELAGQLAAYGKVDLAEVFTEGLADVAGTGAVSAYKKGVTSIYDRATGQRPATAGATSPAQATVSPADVPEPSVEDRASDIGEVQSPATPQGDQSNAQEVSTEVPSRAGDVETPSGVGVVEGQSPEEIAAEANQEPSLADRLATAIAASLPSEELEQVSDSISPQTEAVKSDVFVQKLQRRLENYLNIARTDKPIQSEGEIDLSDRDKQIQEAMAEKPKLTGDFIALAKQIREPLPAVEGIDMQNLERIARSNTLGETALTQELKEYSKDERDKIAQVFGLEDSNPQTLSKGMRVRVGRRPGGFLDVGLAIDGLQEAAITAWSKAKDFKSWSMAMVKQFGERLTPVLRDLWNRITAFVRKTYEIVVDPVLPGWNTERGMIDIFNADRGDEVQSMAKQKTQLQGADIGRAMDILGESLYAKDLSRTIGKELYQNAVDAVMKSGKAEKIIAVESENKILYTYDNGVGMTPEVVLYKFLPAFVSGKTVGEGGGFGLAKLAFLGGPESFKIITIADDTGGNRVKTTIEGTGKGFLEFNKNPPAIDIAPDMHIPLAKGLEMSFEYVSKDFETGTATQINLKSDSESSAYSAEDTVKQSSKYTPQVDLRTITKWGDQLQNTALGELGYGLREKESDGEKAPSYVPLTSFSLPSADVDIIAPEGAKIKKSQWFYVPILNRSILQFTTQIQTREEVALPEGISVNIKPKVEAGTKSYPFTTNRESLSDEVTKQVNDYFSKAGAAAVSKLNDRYRTALTDATKIPGTSQVFLDAAQSVPSDVMNQIVSNPDTIQVFNDVKKIQEAIIRVLRDKFSGIKNVQFQRASFSGLLTGAQAFGVHFGKMDAESTQIYHDIWLSWDLAKKEFKEFLEDNPEDRLNLSDDEKQSLLYDKFLTKIAGVSFHEALHQKINSEGESLARELTFKAGDIVDAVVSLIKSDKSSEEVRKIGITLDQQYEQLQNYRDKEEAGEFITSQGGYDGYALEVEGDGQAGDTGIQKAAREETKRVGRDLRGWVERKIENFGGRAEALRPAADSISYKYLDKEHRADLESKMTRLEGEYRDAKRAGIDVSKSKELFDRTNQVLQEAKENSYQREFNALKDLYPASLGSKVITDFQSGKEIRAYVATEGVATDQARMASAAIGMRAGRQLVAENREKQLKENATAAKAKLPQMLETPEYKTLKDDLKRQVLKAVKYIKDQDPEKNSTVQNEALIAGVNNLLEGDYTGMGKLASLQSVREFNADLKILLDQYGGRLPFFTPEGFIRKNLIKGFEGLVTGESTSRYFKKEAIIRAVGFSHPELRKLWNKHIGNYLEKAQTESSSLQQQLDDELHESSVKHGVAKRKILGKIKGGNRDLFNNRATESQRRMGFAGMLTTWRESTVDPSDDINGIINDLYKSTQAEQEGMFYGAQGKANEAALMQFIKPALDDGHLIQSELGFEIASTPEVWNNYILGKLKDNERAALADYREIASRFQAPLKFISEFYYGKEFDPWVHYLPRTVYSTIQTAPTDTPELTATASRPLPEGSPLPTHGSVLHPRQRLGKDQFYGMDLQRNLQKALNTAAYEVSTAESRFAIQAALKDDNLLPFFGDNKVRRHRFHTALKELHQAELHQGTGVKQSSSAPAAYANEALNLVSNLILSNILSRVRQFPAQFITPFAGALVMVGPRMPQYMSQWISEWSNEQANKLYTEAYPDLKQRISHISPFYDRTVSRSAIDSLADLSLNTEDADFTDEQKFQVYLARVKKAVTSGLEGTPKLLSRTFTQRADYWAVQAIFPVVLQDQLIKEGIIKEADEFTPGNLEAIKNNPKYSEALANSKQAISDIMGNANRFSLRPTAFALRGDQPLWEKLTFGLMQTVTQYAGDRMVDFKDLSYFNKSDKYASQIKTDASKRMMSAMIQAGIFGAISGFIGLITLRALGGIGVGAEGLDEEEEKMYNKLKQIKEDLYKENTRDRALRELGQMMGGPFATNSISNTLIDWGYGEALLGVLKDDIAEEKNQLRQQIKKSKNESKKADLQRRLDELITYEQNLGYSSRREGFSLGPVISEAWKVGKGMIRKATGQKNTTNDADAIAKEYWKQGGLLKKPDPNLLARWSAKFASVLSGDIKDTQKMIDKAREEVARARAVQLKEQKDNKKPRVDRININALR